MVRLVCNLGFLSVGRKERKRPQKKNLENLRGLSPVFQLTFIFAFLAFSCGSQ